MKQYMVNIARTKQTNVLEHVVKCACYGSNAWAYSSRRLGFACAGSNLRILHCTLSSLTLLTPLILVRVGTYIKPRKLTQDFLFADEREDSALEARLRSLTPSERESFHRTRCSTIMGILSFIHQVVKRSLGESTLASGSVKNPSAQTHWTDVVPVDGASFHRLMCLLLLRPRSLGFVTSDLKQSDRLAKASMNLMRELAEASPAFKEGVGVALRSLMEEPGGRFDLGAVSLDEVLGVSGRAASQGAAEMLSLVRGYQQLFHAGKNAGRH